MSASDLFSSIEDVIEKQNEANEKHSAFSLDFRLDQLYEARKKLKEQVEIEILELLAGQNQ